MAKTQEEKDLAKAEKEAAKLAEKEAEETEEDEEVKGGSVSVYQKSTGQFIRTYSKEVHGKNYKDLAEEFAGKVEGREVRSK